MRTRAKMPEMTTPIVDFVRRYEKSNAVRLHMPGHKGVGALGVESADITEIDGADSLYEAHGIIRESEENASELFDCPTFYSAEGSSLAIRAMLYLACLGAREREKRPLVLAARNCHKTFVSAAALLDIDVMWLYPPAGGSYLSCRVTPDELGAALDASCRLPDAVYITSPDYLGNTSDIAGLAAVCHSRGVPLLVDNAHGAYLRFLPRSRHPIDLGADACCDSAHKTLPVLTGGAYLHISPGAPRGFLDGARRALALFGSTSPSYLILASLDAANRELAGDFPARLYDMSRRAAALREELTAHGFEFCGDEEMKLTLAARPWGYTGAEIAHALYEGGVVPEFYDPDYLVLMLSPSNSASDLSRLGKILTALPRRPAEDILPPLPGTPRAAMRIREAIMSPAESVPVSRAEGRVLADTSVGCPPAVPIAVSGEIIDKDAVRCFEYYGIESCTVTTDSNNRKGASKC